MFEGSTHEDADQLAFREGCHSLEMSRLAMDREVALSFGGGVRGKWRGEVPPLTPSCPEFLALAPTGKFCRLFGTRRASGLDAILRQEPPISLLPIVRSGSPITSDARGFRFELSLV